MGTKTFNYTKQELSAWERVKLAFANDWEQTKADFGVEEARDMSQDVDDTIKQIMGTEDAFENHEQAFRFGYTARHRYGADYPVWNDELESNLEPEFDGDFAANRRFIRHGYEYDTSR